MAKLHEVLAVLATLAADAKAAIAECATTFTHRADHFKGLTRTTVAFDDSRANAINKTEHKALVDTVENRLLFTLEERVAPHIDVMAARDATNQIAVADVIFRDSVILTGVPATTLLTLEAEAQQILELHKVIPTLEPGIAWELDPQQGDNVWVTKHPQQTNTTEKEKRVHVLAEATEKHPAQVQAYEKEVAIGKITATHYSGAITPAEKSARIKYWQDMVISIKTARQRANSAEVKQSHYGKTLVAHYKAEFATAKTK